MSPVRPPWRGNSPLGTPSTVIATTIISSYTSAPAYSRYRPRPGAGSLPATAPSGLPAGTWHEHRFFGSSSFYTVGFPSPGATVARTASHSRLGVAAPARATHRCADPATQPSRRSDGVELVIGDQLRHSQQGPMTAPAPRDPRLRRRLRACRGPLGRAVHPRVPRRPRRRQPEHPLTALPATSSA